MRRLAVLSISLAVGLATLLAPALSAAPELIYHRFDPLVISTAYVGNVLYEIKVTGSPTRVVLLLNAPDGTTSPRALRDDGTGGDRIRGDGVYGVSLAASEIVGLLRPDDVFRAEVGYVEIYDGTTLAARGNVFADILTADIPLRPVTALAADAQCTDVLVNLVDRGFVLTSGFDFESVLRRFYELFPDDFDFVNVVAVPGYFQNRFHFGVKSDVRGIGITPFDDSSRYGSAGRLLGITMFPNPIFLDLAEPGFQHELGHQWINFLPFPPLNYVLPHWPLSDLADGIMGFADSGYGQGLQFPCVVTSTPGGARLSPRLEPPVFEDLDLYLMGFLPADQVGPHVVFPRGTQSADLFNLCGSTWMGRLETVTIGDIVRQAGPRTPDAAHSPHSFRIATIIVTPDGLLSDDVMSFYSFFVQRAEMTEETSCHIGFAKGRAKPFRLSTRGLGTLDMSIVSSSGSVAPLSSFATLTPADIAAAAWTLGDRPINGSDGVSELPPGSILLYRTSEGRYGKLEILESGYNLAIRFVTFASSGAVAASSDRLIVPGTFLADLDSGTITAASADLHWSQRSESSRSLDPVNGAEFGVWTP